MQKFRSCKQWCVLRLWSYYKTGLRPAEWSWSGWNGLVLRSWPCWDGLGLVVLCSWSSLCETVFCGRSDIACSHCRCRRDKTVLSAAWTSQYVTRSSATAKIARDPDVGSHSLSLLSNLSPVYNLHPLNSLHYTALLTYHYWRLILRLACTSIPHLCSRWNWKRRLGVGGHALVPGCPEHRTIQSSVSGRSSTVLEQASWQCHVGQFVVGFSAETETHSVPAVIPRHYPVTFLNSTTHGGPSSGIATWATLKIHWLIDWLIQP